MNKPSITFDQLKLAVQNSVGNTVPITKTLNSDLITPVLAYMRLSENNKYSFLLESVIGKDFNGRYSILGSAPSKTLIVGPGRELQGDPLIHLEKELNKTKYIVEPEIPILQVSGGAFGYIGYDCVQYFEPKTACELNDTLGLPDSIFLICDDLVVFDHLFKQFSVITHLRIPNGFNFETDQNALLDCYNNSIKTLDRMISILTSDRIPFPKQGKIVLGNDFKFLTGQKNYESMVVKMKEHIGKGDIFQAVPSQRISRPTSLHPFNVYRHLCTVNPSPYMFYFDFGDFQIVGASPEMLARVEKGKLYNHPIAGTVHRGKTEEEDKRLADGLLADKKERAEHVMLVDLGRNDLNRVCKPGSVSVDKIMQPEYFSHVIHITSSISGDLREDKTCFDAFRSTLPAGTLSGAPKVRAVQLIYEAEKEKRGVYGGAVGHFQYNGDMDTCIAIRTMVFKDGVSYLQAGGGIVYDSVPEHEWIETQNKSMSNIKTLSIAEEYYHNLQTLSASHD
ncbi:putative anthranilate synthase component 1 [Smittium mucronatum]|uniref:anthranilate synthase n=1 Tax=Smittium mucronatum TaxID=133383 RepID=A0A1R0H5M5_9FUNG|nr:putative anthranilate synthase component 1 [Smittium mucronatum]